jgi:SAM-dependent methyltransferase
VSVPGQHPVFARLWPFLSKRLDHGGGAEHRRDLVAPLSGDVFELGCGDGRLFAYYPDTVASLTAVEPEPHLRELAVNAAQRSPVPTEVLAGSAGADPLPLADAAVDAAVCSLVLCSVPDQAAALNELKRVIKPGGMLRFYEHVIAEQPVGASTQRALDRTHIWPKLAAGCHMSRDTMAAITAAGFEIEESDRFTFPRLGMPHVLGTARRP